MAPHLADLDGRRVRAERSGETALRSRKKRVLRVARRVVGREVEGLEVVEVVLDLGAVGDRVAHAQEDVLDLAPDDRERVEAARPRRRPGSVTSTAAASSRDAASRRASAVREPAIASSISAWRRWRAAEGAPLGCGSLLRRREERRDQPLLATEVAPLQALELRAREAPPPRLLAEGVEQLGDGVVGRPALRRHARLQRLLGDAHEMREGRRIRDRELGEHLAVDLVAGLLQAVHQPAVGDLVLARGGVDADDPEAAEIALPGLAVAVGVDERLLHLELRHPVRLRLGAVVALGERQRLRPAVLSLGSLLTRGMVSLL